MSKKLNILSFDCANRSLAVCLLSINPDNDIKSINKDNTDIKLLKVFDLTKGVKYTIPKRAKLLKKCLNGIDSKIDTDIDMVLVEFQMKVNDKSRCVSYQIVYHYSDKCSNIHIISPVLKNKIYFTENLRWSVFGNKYANNYTANKNHTKANLLYYLKENDLMEIIKDVPKKNIDDLADAFLQILGYLYR